MKIVETITPENVGPPAHRFQARCDCGWFTVRVLFADSVRPVAQDHVTETGHTVSIVEHEG